MSNDIVLFHQAYGRSTVTQYSSQLIQHLSGSKHISSVVSLKDWPGRQSLIGESFATTSSGFSKFATFVTYLSEASSFTDLPLLKLNIYDVRKFLLKDTQMNPSDKSTLRKKNLIKCYEESWHRI
jgi:hypothetical protein